MHLVSLAQDMAWHVATRRICSAIGTTNVAPASPSTSTTPNSNTCDTPEAHDGSYSIATWRRTQLLLLRSSRVVGAARRAASRRLTRGPRGKACEQAVESIAHRL